MSEDKFLSIAKAAAIIGVHVDTFRSWSVKGKIESVRTTGNHRRFRKSDVLALRDEIIGESDERIVARVEKLRLLLGLPEHSVFCWISMSQAEKLTGSKVTTGVVHVIAESVRIAEDE